MIFLCPDTELDCSCIWFIHPTRLLNAYNMKNTIQSKIDGLIGKCYYLEKSEITIYRILSLC